MVEQKKPIQEELDSLQSDLEDLEWYVRELAAFLPISVISVNPLGIVIDVNKSFERLSSYSLIEMVGQPLRSIFLQKEEIDKLERKIQEKEGAIEREMVLLSKAKEKIPVVIWASRRNDKEGNYIGYFVGLIDISDFKKLEENLENRVQQRTAALEDSTRELISSRKALMNILEDVEAARAEAERERDRTLAIIENFSDGLLVTEREEIAILNPRAQEFFGLTEEEVKGKKILELEGHPKISPLIKLFKEKGTTLFREELRLHEDLILEVSTIPVVREGQERGMMVILHEITREKIIESMKTEFVSITAHQLRTPLSAIKWILRMFLDGDLGPVSDTQRRFLEKTYTSNERMIKLINDLLNVTRIEEGRFLYRIQTTDLVALTEKMLFPFREVAKKKKIEFEFEKPRGRPPKLPIDQEKMAFVIQNVIDNAVNYTKTGKIKVSLEYSKEEKQFLFEVRDSGIGIPKSQHKRVFSRFFRAANAIKAETEGTGLGLFIAKNIIEAHGGKIWFESEEKKGTTFYFTIPVRSEEEFKKFLVGF